jgi:hypothetical protein
MQSCAAQAVNNGEIEGELLERLQPIVDEFARHITGTH